MEALVQTVLFSGAEVWGGSRLIFLGVGRLHLKVSLQFEMQMVLLRFDAKKRCIEFWVKALRI